MSSWASVVGDQSDTHQPTTRSAASLTTTLTSFVSDNSANRNPVGDAAGSQRSYSDRRAHEAAQPSDLVAVDRLDNDRVSVNVSGMQIYEREHRNVHVSKIPVSIQRTKPVLPEFTSCKKKPQGGSATRRGCNKAQTRVHSDRSLPQPQAAGRGATLLNNNATSDPCNVAHRQPNEDFCPTQQRPLDAPHVARTEAAPVTPATSVVSVQDHGGGGGLADEVVTHPTQVSTEFEDEDDNEIKIPIVWPPYFVVENLQPPESGDSVVHALLQRYGDAHKKWEVRHKKGLKSGLSHAVIVFKDWNRAAHADMEYQHAQRGRSDWFRDRKLMRQPWWCHEPHPHLHTTYGYIATPEDMKWLDPGRRIAKWRVVDFEAMVVKRVVWLEEQLKEYQIMYSDVKTQLAKEQSRQERAGQKFETLLDEMAELRDTVATLQSALKGQADQVREVHVKALQACGISVEFQNVVKSAVLGEQPAERCIMCNHVLVPPTESLHACRYVLPCGHAHCCGYCSRDLFERGQVCVLCTTRVTSEPHPLRAILTCHTE